jgi:hypothetical protein
MVYMVKRDNHQSYGITMYSQIESSSGKNRGCLRLDVALRGIITHETPPNFSTNTPIRTVFEKNASNIAMSCIQCQP